MNDRSLVQANGTLLNILPMGKALAGGGLLLVMLFTLVKPEASLGLGVAERLIFWLLHVGLGLIALMVSSRWLASGERLPSSTWLAVLLSGLAGALVAAPGYLVLDWVYAGKTLDLTPEIESQNLISSLLEEYIGLAPWFVLSWVVINLPVLMPHKEAELGINDSVECTTRIADTVTDTEHTDDAKSKVPPASNAAQQFLNSLPGVIGTDVIAVSSDLHYLNVWTVAGRTTVLGNLKDVAEELEPIGLRVHRSHWVANAHVRRIVGTSNNAMCILSNELRIPISRRRWKACRDRFGRGVVSTQLT